MKSGALLSTILITLAPAAAQCLVENAGPPNPNINRPSSADTPAAAFPTASRLNRLLPRWLCFSAGYRARWEGYSGGGFQDGNSEEYVLTRFRLGMLIKPAAWMKAYAELQDARVFGRRPPLAPPYQSTWDLRRAYIDLGGFEEGRISLRVGRQDLNFGHGRLLGTAYWRNTSRGFDAATMAVNWNSLSLRAFSASQVVASANGLSHHQQGNILHGVYGGLKNWIPKSVIEPYVFWRLSPRIRAEGGALAKLDEKAVGVRIAGVRSRFDYDAELVGEVGYLGADRIRAWAWTGIGGYTPDSLPWRPRLFIEYGFASGDTAPRDGRRGAFDPIYPNVHSRHGLADQVSWQNLKEVRAGVRVSPRRNWTVALTFSDWRLAHARDAFYDSSGAVVARDPEGRSGTHIGIEGDLEAGWRLNRELELGAGIGHICPGGFLARTRGGHTYTYPFLMLNYNFF